MRIKKYQQLSTSTVCLKYLYAYPIYTMPCCTLTLWYVLIVCCMTHTQVNIKIYCFRQAYVFRQLMSSVYKFYSSKYTVYTNVLFAIEMYMCRTQLHMQENIQMHIHYWMRFKLNLIFWFVLREQFVVVQIAKLFDNKVIILQFNLLAVLRMESPTEKM